MGPTPRIPVCRVRANNFGPQTQSALSLTLEWVRLEWVQNANMISKVASPPRPFRTLPSDPIQPRRHLPSARPGKGYKKRAWRCPGTTECWHRPRAAAARVSHQAVTATNTTVRSLTSVGATSAGAMRVGTMNVGATSAGTTSAGTMNVGATSVGTMNVGATSVGTMNVGATSAGTTSAGATRWRTWKIQRGSCGGRPSTQPARVAMECSTKCSMEWSMERSMDVR